MILYDPSAEQKAPESFDPEIFKHWDQNPLSEFV